MVTEIEATGSLTYWHNHVWKRFSLTAMFLPSIPYNAIKHPFIYPGAMTESSFSYLTLTIV